MLARPEDPLASFHPAVRSWFEATFSAPTAAQRAGWPPLARGESALLLAPTGSGKTLAAFLACLDRLLFQPAPPVLERCRVLYVSPLKALAADVERNLQAPLAGIAARARQRGDAFTLPSVAIRTGDTPARERARLRRQPPDVLITTPESLYLLLTSASRAALQAVDTVILDEIHALVPTKRGAHLALSLERLERLAGRRLQRIGLSATQRPLDEVARFLGGVEDTARGPAAFARGAAAQEIRDEFGQTGLALRHRPVTVVDAGSRKALELRIEVPVEDMAKLGIAAAGDAGGPAQPGPSGSIWSAIHPRLLELVQAHRSTLVFVNSRRLAERMAAALNDLAGETVAHAHHGSIAREQRVGIEERLKRGEIRALVATSSLELGIDMGAIDLVVQIEAPPTVASGLQRVGRGGHQVGAASRGVLFPKFRGDLVACAALARAMREGEVEAIRYPRNPLDVLAQQIVAAVSMEPFDAEDLFRMLRRAAPFAALSRPVFDGVLDMLSGRYDSDDFAALRPRLTWDRAAGLLQAREGAHRIAITSGGTIPDRGLYGVFLAGAPRSQARVGELDEEMVFESRPGDRFLLGASTWRIEEITHDRVLVSPAPGEPGRMPFWRGDAAGRSLELGRRIGALLRRLRGLPHAAARALLEREYDLGALAARNLLGYLGDQQAAAGAVPDDRTVVVERVRDGLGDWRICVLSPLGGRVHAPWAMAAVARVADETGLVVEALWTDDGFVLRFPDSDAPPDVSLLLPSAAELEPLVLRQLASTRLFAARFREVASRALLLPKRRPGQRAPLWQLRKRSQDLLAVASRFSSFPMLLETYRECLRDVFDLPALRSVLEQIGAGEIRVETVDAAKPSPFAAAILFGFVANFLYEGDAPPAERRAQALAIDPAQLRELLGDAELRDLLDAGVLAGLERELQREGDALRVATPDAVHDLLLRLGDLSREALRARATGADAALERLLQERRAVALPLAGGLRFVAVEHASRYRDALSVPLPPGLPEAFLDRVPDPEGDLVLRHARTHGPFPIDDLVRRFAVPRERLEPVLRRLTAGGRLVEGAFRPGGSHREWCDPDVLQRLRHRSLARLRREAEPVEPECLARFVSAWHGIGRPKRGPDAILDVIGRLQGAALPASILESEILPARIAGYDPADLDALAAEGEIVWCGFEPVAERDGRLALFLADAAATLRRPRETPPVLPLREQRILGVLATRGASFFAAIHDGSGGGFPRDTVDALWNLLWKGLVANDGLHALRAWLAPAHARSGRRKLPAAARALRSRRVLPPAAQGRWSLLPGSGAPASAGDPGAGEPAQPTPTQRMAALAQQLLERHGVVTREVAASEGIAGGFRPVLEVLQALEAAGRIRRGYFVAGVGATQFATPTALDLLRRLRNPPAAPEIVCLPATDPANPYGAILRWPEPAGPDAARRGARAVGARVVLVNGALVAWLAKGGRQLLTWLPVEETDRAVAGDAIARELALVARRSPGFALAEIDGTPASAHPLARRLLAAGFVAGPRALHLRAGGDPGPGPDPGKPADTLR